MCWRALGPRFVCILVFIWIQAPSAKCRRLLRCALPDRIVCRKYLRCDEECSVLIICHLSHNAGATLWTLTIPYNLYGYPPILSLKYSWLANNLRCIKEQRDAAGSTISNGLLTGHQHERLLHSLTTIPEAVVWCYYLHSDGTITGIDSDCPACQWSFRSML